MIYFYYPQYYCSRLLLICCDFCRAVFPYLGILEERVLPKLLCPVDITLKYLSICSSLVMHSKQQTSAPSSAYAQQIAGSQPCLCKSLAA